MKRNSLWLGALCAASWFAACVDTESGDRGTYASPCGSTFRALLLCGRESGGADPQSPPGPGITRPATCADACEILVACGSGSASECTDECLAEAPAQSLLDCVVAEGCNYRACVP